MAGEGQRGSLVAISRDDRFVLHYLIRLSVDCSRGREVGGGEGGGGRGKQKKSVSKNTRFSGIREKEKGGIKGGGG